MAKRVSMHLKRLDDEIQTGELQNRDLKEDNEARIVWYRDQKYAKTKNVLVYLHGFTASQGEGFPTHRDFAHRFGMNLYLSRLSRHGLKQDRLSELTPQKLLESASKAVETGKELGQNIYLMGTSTGASLALYLASILPEIKAVIAYSPLIRFYNPRIDWITRRSGGFLFNGLMRWRNSFHIQSIDPFEKQYWYPSYDLQSLNSLRTLIYKTMCDSTYRRIKCPVFVGYFYKNKQLQDQRVSVPAILNMFKYLATPDDLKRKRNFPSAASHVIACKYTSRSWKEVEDETFLFAEEILQMKPVVYS